MNRLSFHPLFSGQSIPVRAFIALALLLAFLAPPVAPVRAQATPPYEVRLSLQSVAPNPAFVGQTVTVTLSAVVSAGLYPTGAVAIKSGEQTVCSVTLNASGSASCDLQYATAGEYAIKAVYTGEASFLPAVSSEVTLKVRDRLTPALSIVSHTPNPSFLSQTVSVKASFSSLSPAPTGSVTLYRGDAQCALKAAQAADRCSQTIGADGSAACDLQFTQTGEIYLCAEYAGDVAYLAGVSAAAPHFVASGNTFTQITSVDPSPSTVGKPVWVYFKVAQENGAPVTVGTVSVASGSASCSAPLTDGRCQLTLSQPDIQPIIASYSGGQAGAQTFDASTSAAYRQRVNAPPTAIAASASRVPYDAVAGAQIADLSASDPNADDDHTFALVSGAGATHNGYFRVENNQLILASGLGSLDGKLFIRLRATDAAGLSVEQALVFTITERPMLPNTGFPQGRASALPAQTPEKQYQAEADLRLEIPSLQVKVDIVGVPLTDDGWDTTWLGQQAGWLNGTAFPTWEGNAGLAAHNYLPSGLPGPFAGLNALRWGDEIRIHAYGAVYVYAVRSVTVVDAQALDVIDHKEDAWITLITCRSYNEASQVYDQRVVVQARLVDIQ